MGYKNDHLLVIANRYGAASGDAKVEMYETYDKIRDLTVSGPTLGVAGYGAASNFLMELARMVAPASFMPVMGAGQSMNIPGTSYSSPVSGGNSILPGGQAGYGFGNLGTFPGFPAGGAAPIGSIDGNLSSSGAIGSLGSSMFSGIGNFFASTLGIGSGNKISGVATGGAVNLDSAATMLNGAGAVSGMSAGFGKGSSVILPLASVVSGIGGLASAIGPYFGPFGIAAGIAGNMASGYGGAVVGAYQSAAGRILNNADTILSNRVRNIETVCKQLDLQGDMIRKSLKDSIDGDSKAIQNL